MDTATGLPNQNYQGATIYYVKCGDGTACDAAPGRPTCCGASGIVQCSTYSNYMCADGTCDNDIYLCNSKGGFRTCYAPPPPATPPPAAPPPRQPPPPPPPSGTCAEVCSSQCSKLNMTHVQDCADCHKAPFNSTESNVTMVCTVNAVDYNKTAEEGAAAQEAAAVEEAKEKAKAEVTQVTVAAVSRATTMAAVTATVSASVGALAGTVAKAAGSAAGAAGGAAGGAGGGAGGGAVSGLMGAQRINMYGDLAGGGQTVEEVAAKGVQTNPMMASFGVFGGGASRRRRLATQNNQVNNHLLLVLGDAAVSSCCL